MADATTSVEKRAVVAAVGGSPSAPPMLAAQGTPRSLPRLSVQEAHSRQVTAPAALPAEEPLPKLAPGQESKTELIVEAPADVWPTLGGGAIVRGVPAPREREPAPVVVEAPPVSQPAEWAEAPRPSVDEWASLPAASAPAPAPVPATAARLTDDPAPPQSRIPAKDLETVFMQRAEDSLQKGTCDRFLLGLEDIALDSEKNPRSEQARVLRARCFDTQMRPRQAMNEYRKYLEAYPRGKFSTEAHEALGE